MIVTIHNNTQVEIIFEKMRNQENKFLNPFTFEGSHKTICKFIESFTKTFHRKLQGTKLSRTHKPEQGTLAKENKRETLTRMQGTSRKDNPSEPQDPNGRRLRRRNHTEENEQNQEAMLHRQTNTLSQRVAREAIAPITDSVDVFKSSLMR